MWVRSCYRDRSRRFNFAMCDSERRAYISVQYILTYVRLPHNPVACTSNRRLRLATAKRSVPIPYTDRVRESPHCWHFWGGTALALFHSSSTDSLAVCYYYWRGLFLKMMLVMCSDAALFIYFTFFFFACFIIGIVANAL